MLICEEGWRNLRGDGRNGVRSEEKRMKGMDEARVLGSTQPTKLVFLSLILQLISNGSWVNDWVSIWVQIGGQN